MRVSRTSISFSLGFAQIAMICACVGGLIERSFAQCAGSWVQIPQSGSWPPARGMFGMSYDAARDRVVIFGSRQTLGQHGLLGDTWEFDGTNWVQLSPPNPRPAARHSVSMGYSAAEERTILLGGLSSSTTPLREAWEWNGSAWQLVSTSGPAASYGPYATMSAGTNQFLAYGGYDGTWFTRALWAFDPVTNDWNMLDANGPFDGLKGAMFYNSVTGTLQISGGYQAVSSSEYHTSNSQFQWQGLPAGWIASSSAPWTPRGDMAYCQSTASGYIVGGANDSPAPHDNDAWRLDFASGTWTQLASLPRGVMGARCVYDSLRHRVVLFGGYFNPDLTQESNEMWVLSVPEPGIVSQPANVATCRAGSASFSVTTAGVAPFAYSWRFQGIPINSTTNPSAATATLTLSNVQATDAGSYDCVVSNACGSIASALATLRVSTLTGDVNCDCAVDLIDLTTLLANFGTTCE